ncbi:MAG TPA: 1-(5-phosphoribosyl)-5-[(5-phosphoribosylamino)methylideneamino]imidazole-4-carboxamide isomerase [Spirochaetota bacterium]|nr:1-(5-phosphoribosyl)-5-[(5-phosphoribosylamino)methylideneamino]imidazole-4-carboxamide isomerase [Spirochaetota bacterium]HOM09337.1 1-(5-phosphoribosyl)-5-[(5-phosphoribosylamino)methylideneamino]imidazole-4-carboxamide isomerase [Spirochaetota bacterium]HPP49924.1 1-(5-phosphoribosyl)-5-[(5-phosphoribosylamino)methylideneamino]imidazole-4-carboxamide isomerase [Spirochaetota bacterium]HXK65145.1 1-(5-phosphoribosyl)-5-[(5-phosphoribosylamino)methylideneamino]imidazole-4-carboxamide isomera
MLVIPAIDLKEGRCVRLVQGDPLQETVYSYDPESIAKQFEEAGAKLIHVVDLDGAFEGQPVNMHIVKRIAKAVSIPIEIGGGIRTETAIKMYLDEGIERIIMGTVLMEDTFREIAERFKEYIIAGVDAKDLKIATHGWKKIIDMDAIKCIKELQSIGISEIIYTDIATDGMLQGPNYTSIEKILSEIPGIALIASGGISAIEDLEKLKKYENHGLKGCIVGKAIYDGRIDLRNAITLCD